MLPLKEEFSQRGLLNQYTDEKLFELYDQGGQKFYFGMDPTADSLHLGNFINFMNAVHLMRRGNIALPLVGGATGMIGDPGGKDSERTFLDEKTLAHNVQALQTQISSLLENIKQTLQEDLQSEDVFNNQEFYDNTNFLDFLRNIGKYITVNSMMSRDTVKKRLTEPDKSISYTEFSYMLIQGNDFYRLFQEKDCLLQIAGSDQRGNITIGTELIRKKLNKTAYGFTCPLILDSSGKKFGKSEGNALFLDAEKTSPYQLYQYFLNVADQDVERYLKLLTFYEFEEIQEIVSHHAKDPAKRHGQQKLADYVVRLISGADAFAQAKLISEILFGTGEILETIQNLSKSDIDALVRETGNTRIDRSEEYSLRDLLAEVGFASSGREAKQLIQSGAISLNEQKIEDISYILKKEDIYNGLVVLRKGKKGFAAIKILGQ